VKRLPSLALAAIFAAGMPLSLFADDLSRVEQDLATKWKNYKTMTARVTTEINLVPGLVTNSNGTFEYMLEGDKEKYRMDSSAELTLGGQAAKSRQTTVCDGEFLYVLTDQEGQKTLTKQRATARPGWAGGARMLQELKTHHDLALLPDERVGDEDSYLIEATSRTGGLNSPPKMRMFFSKKTGILLKMMGLDEASMPMMTLTYQDVRINPGIDPSRFVFEAPAGVTMVDQTKP
jgi:outer membrane lipoprotein-sorting protein